MSHDTTPIGESVAENSETTRVVSPEELEQIRDIQLSARAAEDTLEIALNNHSGIARNIHKAKKQWWSQVAERLGLNLQRVRVSVNEETGVLTIKQKSEFDDED